MSQITKIRNYYLVWEALLLCMEGYSQNQQLLVPRSEDYSLFKKKEKKREFYGYNIDNFKSHVEYQW